MANPYLILWCDPTQNKIYSGWQKNTQAATPILKQGDEIGCEIHWVKTGEYTATMQEISLPPSATVRLAIGRLDSAPSAGTFTLTYGANTTGALAYNIEATALQTALNGLASITAEGGVTVVRNGSQYRIVWNNAGEYDTALSANVDRLYPTSDSSSAEVRAGTATVNRIVIFKIRQSVIAGTTTFTAVSQPVITVSTIFENNWRVSISPNPKEGVFALTVVKGSTTYKTISITYNADSFEIASALNNLNVVEDGTFTVIKSGDFTWDITAPSAVDSISATSGLIGFSALYGVLDMNTGEVEEFLAGTTSAEAILEVEADIAGEIQTLIQTRVNVLNDLIETSSFNLVNMGDVMPVDSVVRYDTSQALTDPQKETARQNIDAVSLDEIGDAFDLVNLPTDNEKAAMQNSVLPSSTNPFVTLSENNPFDQDLNTDSDVQFNTVTVGTGTVIINNDGIIFPDDTIQTTAAAAVDTSSFLQKANNLSDLVSASTARTNLGLGTMAVETATNYLAKADNLSGLANTSTSRSNLGLGTGDAPVFSAVYAGGTSGTFSGITAGTLSVSTSATSDFIVNSSGVSAYGDGGLIVEGLSNTSRINQEGGPSSEVGIWTGSLLTTETGIVADGVVFPDGTKQTTAYTGSTESFFDLISREWEVDESGSMGSVFSSDGGSGKTKRASNTSVSGGTTTSSVDFEYSVEGLIPAVSYMRFSLPNTEDLPNVYVSAGWYGTSGSGNLQIGFVKKFNTMYFAYIALPNVYTEIDITSLISLTSFVKIEITGSSRNNVKVTKSDGSVVVEVSDRMDIPTLGSFAGCYSNNSGSTSLTDALVYEMLVPRTLW
jgi:hypothetical protein